VLALETFVSLLIIVDIFIKIFIRGREAYSDPILLLDVLLLVLFLIIALWLGMSLSNKEDEELDMTLILARFVFQGLRVAVYILKTHHKLKEKAAINDIVLEIAEHEYSSDSEAPQPSACTNPPCPALLI